MAQDNPKYVEYAFKISGVIGQMLNDEDNEYHIDKKELNDSDNLTEFIHALATVAPASVFNSITGEKKNHLEFNHVANQLCFQFGKSED